MNGQKLNLSFLISSTDHGRASFLHGRLSLSHSLGRDVSLLSPILTVGVTVCAASLSTAPSYAECKRIVSTTILWFVQSESVSPMQSIYQADFQSRGLICFHHYSVHIFQRQWRRFLVSKLRRVRLVRGRGLAQKYSYRKNIKPKFISFLLTR